MTGKETRWEHDGRRLFNKEYRMLSFVPRWSIAPRVTQQSDAEHCFFVALYTSQLCDWLGVKPEHAVWIVGWALRHDAYEVWTGDPPGPAKHMFIDENKMSAYIDMFAAQVEDFKVYRDAIWMSADLNISHDSTLFKGLAVRIIKVADLIDECFFLRYELAMGNSLVKDLFHLSLTRLEEKCGEWGEEVCEYLMRCVKQELSRVEGEGALIPSLRT